MELVSAGEYRPMQRRNQPQHGIRKPAQNFIRAWRKSRGLTLEQLGEMVDMTASTISAIERTTSGYSWESLEDLADALQCTTADLLSGPPEVGDGIMLSEFRKVPVASRKRALDAVRLFQRDED